MTTRAPKCNKWHICRRSSSPPGNVQLNNEHGDWDLSPGNDVASFITGMGGLLTINGHFNLYSTLQCPQKWDDLLLCGQTVTSDDVMSGSLSQTGRWTSASLQFREYRRSNPKFELAVCCVALQTMLVVINTFHWLFIPLKAHINLKTTFWAISLLIKNVPAWYAPFQSLEL